MQLSRWHVGMSSLLLQSIRHAGLAVRAAEDKVLDTAQARLELQGLSSRLAAQQQHLASTRQNQELQGNSTFLVWHTCLLIAT